MALTPGTRLGPYEVVAPIGAGGMGEVYRATDTKLKRQVAIKVLPAALTVDPERLARFQREAEVLASLNHPNIAAIYGLEDAGGVRALVMELVEGPTLADRVAQGVMPFADALPVARQIAGALEAAHEQGIIHRDLKPANIKVRDDGVVKVLDFGLAKAMATAREPGVLSQDNSPTVTSPAMTQAGVVLGTAAYMSPEQAKGRAVDKRSDVWAYGAVLYEMLTGERAFRGDNIAETLAEVIKGTVNWGALPGTVPPAVRQLIEGCLQRDRALRIGDISTVRYVLSGAAGTDTTTAVVPPSAGSARSWGAAAAGVLIGALAAGLGVWQATGSSSADAPELMRFALTTSRQPIQVSNLDRQLAISPDGRRVAYVTGGGGPPQLLVRSLDAVEPVVVVDGVQPRVPFFSPDSQWVGYYSNGDAELRKVSVSGGQSLPLWRNALVPRGATWTSDGSIVLGVNRAGVGLHRLPSSGGPPVVLTRPDSAQGELAHEFPAMLPSGNILFTVWTGDEASSQIAVLDVKTGGRRALLRGGTQAEWVPPGHLVYASGSALHAVRFDPVRLETLGPPVPIVPRVFVAPATGAAMFSVSSTGTLVYIPSTDAAAERRSLVWVDRQGLEEPLAVPPHRFTLPRISPDGSRVALDIRDVDNSDIWIWTFARHVLTRLTNDPASDWYPVWTPDGARVVFGSQRDGQAAIYSQPVDAAGPAEKLADGGFPYTITPEGRTLVYSAGASLRGLASLALATPSAKAPLWPTTFSEGNADLSRDGRWLAYQSSESGRNEVYVRPFPDVNSGKWQVSPAGGTQPVWSRDGKELFYVDGASGLTTATLRPDRQFSVTGTTRLFDMTPYYRSEGQGRPYDVSPDGRRFLAVKDVTDPASRASAIVVLNWTAELKRLVP